MMVSLLGHFALELVTAPAVEPVTVEEAKTHLRVDSEDFENDYIETLITTARQEAENFLRRALITQTWRLSLDGWPARTLVLPIPPLQSVSTVKYLDTSGTLRTLTADTDYVVDAASTPARIYPAYAQTWPTVRAIEKSVQVEFVAGYGDAASDVPQAIRHAILLIIRDYYDFRGSTIAGAGVAELPRAAESLLWQYRDYRF